MYDVYSPKCVTVYYFNSDVHTKQKDKKMKWI